MACIVVAYIVMDSTVMDSIVMAYIVMAYIVMDSIFMAYIVMASADGSSSHRATSPIKADVDEGLDINDVTTSQLVQSMPGEIDAVLDVGHNFLGP